MKRNSTYIAFVLAGALIGERVSMICNQLQQVWSHQLHGVALQLSGGLQVVNYGFDTAWERNNQGVSTMSLINITLECAIASSAYIPAMCLLAVC